MAEGVAQVFRHLTSLLCFTNNAGDVFEVTSGCVEKGLKAWVASQRIEFRVSRQVIIRLDNSHGGADLEQIECEVRFEFGQYSCDTLSADLPSRKWILAARKPGQTRYQ